MNLVLLFASDFIDTTPRVRLSGRRLEHVRDVHRVRPGDSLAVGLENGLMGRGTIAAIDRTSLTMDVTLDTPPPPGLDLNLIVALPRPKVLNRTLVSAASLGVKRLWLIQALRVEKSYWKSPRLTPENIRLQCLLGLEQARDTHMPEVVIRKGFKPFVEDELPGIIEGTQACVAHPYASLPCPRAVEGSFSLIIGPEGGFIPYEIEKLEACGVKPVQLGHRILRVETVIPYLLGRLFG
ncbi:16S rRNA (uracil(1498)-N(3))-methyltransferase [Desulfatiferula olefinivorans]